MENQIKRCGYCGRYFIGSEFVSLEDMSVIEDNEEEITLGYCPNAQQEHYEQNHESE